MARNETYKDQYHFRDSYSLYGTNDLPSLNTPPTINTTIKENPFRANVEIEKDEIILEPDLTGLYKARGKTHKGGGIDVNLKPNSFVYSDNKTLAIGKEDHKLFEFKEPAKYDKRQNTPAEVLRRNVDIKHYNTLISNIEDPKVDHLAKKSSERMLEKYINTLGNIAYIQEFKKGLPQGIPLVAQGTAPVYDPLIKDSIDRVKQYAKYGGTIDNPFEEDPCPCGRNTDGSCIEDCPPEVYQKILPKARQVSQAPAGYKPLYSTPKEDLYGKFGELKTTRGQVPGKKMSNAEWTQYLKNETPAQRAARKQRERSQLNVTETPDDYVKIPKAAPLVGEDCPCGYKKFGGCEPCDPVQQAANPTIEPNPTPNSVSGEAQQPLSADWQFTPWQKVSQLHNLSKYAGARRYMPTRTHINPTYAQPSLVNPEQAVGDIRAMANSQIGSLNSLNPIMRNAQAANAYGQILDQIPGVRSQYDNQNAQINNQFRMANTEIRNNATAMNAKNDQDYYQQTIVGQTNFNNMKSYLGDQYMNNVMGDVQANQTLAYNMLTQNNPAYRYDFKTGKFVRNPKSILDVQSGGRGDLLNEYLDKITGDWGKLDNKDRINLLKIMTAKGFQPTQQKMGGTFNPYK